MLVGVCRFRDSHCVLTWILMGYTCVTHTHTHIHTHTSTHTHTHSPSLLLQVKVLSGADKDSVGSLLSVDEGDGIVRVKATGEVKFFSLKNLAKLHKT